MTLVNGNLKEGLWNRIKSNVAGAIAPNQRFSDAQIRHRFEIFKSKVDSLIPSGLLQKFNAALAKKTVTEARITDIPEIRKHYIDFLRDGMIIFKVQTWEEFVDRLKQSYPDIHKYVHVISQEMNPVKQNRPNQPNKRKRFVPKENTIIWVTKTDVKYKLNQAGLIYQFLNGKWNRVDDKGMVEVKNRPLISILNYITSYGRNDSKKIESVNTRSLTWKNANSKQKQLFLAKLKRLKGVTPKLLTSTPTGASTKPIIPEYRDYKILARLLL